MKKLLAILLLMVVALSACGYHLGGLRKTSLRNCNTFSVEMFDNNTLYSGVAEQLTTALTDTMQRDGTYRLASPSKSDFTIAGVVTSVQGIGLRTNAGDTYLSSEIGLIVEVDFRIIQTRTGKTLYSRKVTAEGSFFNDSTGNIQTARDSALSYATRRAAELIVQSLTLP